MNKSLEETLALDIKDLLRMERFYRELFSSTNAQTCFTDIGKVDGVRKQITVLIGTLGDLADILHVDQDLFSAYLEGPRT